MTDGTSEERLGLGLSGGGFRASFFHIGLLAQMAEQGLLRHVEVISTVSGGSIIGALYYLHLKNLLETTEDRKITDRHYADIVKVIETAFLEATRKNIRMSTYASFLANFRMIFLNYSRSDRIAELYNEWLYQGVLANAANPVQMRNLKIFPPGQPDFHPRHHNAERRAKVPILVLNATTLNTGGNWQFTAQTMGEPPVRKSYAEADNNSIRLRRAGDYADMVAAPVNQREFPLGHAVAASACVPGLFDPMSVSNLYKDLENDESIQVQLVDGGVYDNQGVAALLRNGCSSFIVSDAASQSETENNPGVSAVSVLLRVSSILQTRVRNEGILHLLDSQDSDSVAYINLRQGLAVREIAWVDEHGTQAPDTVIPANCKGFGVDPGVQESLSKMRTDLDAFTEVEAYSLMLDGYLLSGEKLVQFKSKAGSTSIRDSATLPESGWKFFAIKPWLAKPTADYLKQLKAAQTTFGKALILMPWLWIPLMAPILLAAYVFWRPVLAWMEGSIPIYAIFMAGALWLVNYLAPKWVKAFPLMALARPQATMIKGAGESVLLSIGTLFILLYLKLINPLFLWQGTIDKLSPPSDS